MTIYTLGHSTHPQEGFAKLMEGRVQTLIDVRSHPGSRWPQFQKENLEKWIPEAGFRYEWMPELGGWDERHIPLMQEMANRGVDLKAYARGKFPKQRISQSTLPKTESEFQQGILPCVKPEWTNTGLRDYSFFMSLQEFMNGAERLMARSDDVAIMCCECEWYRCHRSMISDYLAFRGVETLHIMPRMRQKNKVKFVDGQKLTPHSSVIGNRLERYDDFIRAIWDQASSAGSSASGLAMAAAAG
jgi:uncharacterized protein (DUF488 family)